MDRLLSPMRKWLPTGNGSQDGCRMKQYAHISKGILLWVVDCTHDTSSVTSVTMAFSGAEEVLKVVEVQLKTNYSLG